ncbi:T9SS type A sorting domain-containing protein [Flavobacterium sp. ZT3R17]|uniref:RCC1 domain-containing protein n=1 Tax=Flavobacterium cryoconiti TaxID=3398736 RepID=UPI003A8A8D90
MSTKLTHSLALKTNGTLWAWGSNDFGELGNGQTSTPRYIPTQIGTNTDWLSISAGGNFSAALRTDGTLWTWGDNSYGALGDGTKINKIVPTKIGIDTNWQFISSSLDTNIGRKSDGTDWIWGYNYSGQLGDGTNIDKNVPTKIVNIIDLQTISQGWEHNTVIKTDGTLWVWGWNAYGQLGNGTTANTNSPININCANLGIEKLEDDNIFSIYPNPAKDIIHFKNNNNKFINKVIITNLNGKIVLKQNNNSTELNVQLLKQGIYLIQIMSEGKTFKNKFIKN